jgi:DNA modification methylase
MATKDGEQTLGQLKIEWRPPAQVRPYEANPRLIPQSAIDKVATSLGAYGWQQPIVVDSDGVVIVGHVRLLAALKLGHTAVPVCVAELSPTQAKAYRLADNRTSQESSWNPELLIAEIASLAECNYDLEATGFDADELAGFVGPAPQLLGDPDEVPQPPAEPISRPGDLWILGRHRLLCGDATDAACVARVMNGSRATLMATDPPYLVGYDGGNHPPTWANGGKKPGAPPEAATKHWDSYIDHDSSLAFYEAFLRAAIDGALTKTAAIYMCFGMMRAPLVFEAWQRAGLLLHQVLIWNKSRIVLSRSDYCWNYEPLAYGWIKGSRPRSERRPPANATAVWEIASGIEDGPQDHPTCKPLELIRRPIEYHTKAGELIYEPFCGSGTAIVAAEMTGRACRAIELSPAFCDVAIERYRRLTGQEVRRDG